MRSWGTCFLLVTIIDKLDAGKADASQAAANERLLMPNPRSRTVRNPCAPEPVQP